MKTVSIADAITGVFTGSVKTLTESLIDQNTPPGCIAVDGVHDPLSRRVDVSTGEVVPYRPAPPDDTPAATWCWHEAAERWVAEPTLAEHKARAWARIKSAREAATAAPLQHAGQIFDARPASRDAIARKALAAHVAWTAGGGGEWSTWWTTASNEPVCLDARQVIALALALDQRDQAEHEASQRLRVRIDDAQAVGDINDITWPGGPA